MTYHVIYDVDGLADGGGLKTHVGHAANEVFDGDLLSGKSVEIEFFNLLGVSRHVLGFDEDSCCSGFLVVGAHFGRVCSIDRLMKESM